MAGETGRSSSDIGKSEPDKRAKGLEKHLLEQGASFSFFQAMRLLRLLGQKKSGRKDTEGSIKDHVRVRPKLSLSFPPADIDRIEKRGGDATSIFQITANFLGLYGVSSPLPTFYTEDLLDEASEDRSISRDFIDIINHRLYELFFLSSVKYRQYIQVVEEENRSHTERLFSLVGLSEASLRKDIPAPHFLLRYIGLFTQFPRSAAGLKTLLQDALGGPPVDIVPCLKRNVKIPEDQRICLGKYGGMLGNDSFLGEEIEDLAGMFRIRIGPMGKQVFQSCFPGGEGYKKMCLLTRLYMTDPLEYDIELILKKGEKKTICLGDPEWCSLGMNTWIFAGEDAWESKSIVYPDEGFIL